MGIDLAKYRDDNPDYFGGSTLADVAADLHERSGAAATGETLDQFNRRYGFDGQIAAEARPQAGSGFGLRESRPTAGDYVQSLGIGLDQFGQVLGRGMQWAGLDRAGKAIEGVYKEREAATRAEQSEGYKAEMDKPFTEKRTDGSGIFGYGLGPGATSPTKILGTIVESAPSMAAAGGPSVAMTRGLIGFGVKSGVAGIVGSGLGEGTIGGLYAAKEGEDQILEAPDDVLRQHPDYQTALAGQPADMPEEARHAAAKASVARSEALRSGLLVGGATALLGAPSGHFLGKSVGGETGKTLLRTMGKQGALEAVQEASQNAVERVIHNQAAQKYINPDQDLMEGVVEETAGGAITGGVMGFGMGGAAYDGASLRFRRDFTAETGKALANGSVAQLADADLDRAYLVADGLYRENPEDGVRQVLLGLGAEQRRRQNEARGFPLNEILADEEAARQAALAGPGASGEPAAGAAPETPAGPDRAAELATLSKRQLNDLAGGLGIQAPGRIKRDALVAAVLQAEETARAWNEPDAVEARYREAHAAPFPDRLDDFLFQAAPAPLVAPEAAPQTPAPAMETPAEPDRAASLAGLPFTRLKTMAVSLGIERPGRMRRDALVPAIVAAEEQARRYYDPENIQARYQEEHAAPFPTRQDAFLDRAAPTGRRPRSRNLAPAAPEVLPTGEVPLVEAGAEPAGPAAQAPTEQPTSRPALVEQTPEGALPTGEVPLVEAGRPAETFPTPEAESAAPATPTSEDLAALSRRRLNDLAATLGLERPGAVRREDLVGRIEAARQEPAATGQPEAAVRREPVAARPQTAQERPWLRETGEKATVGALLRADDMMVARKNVEGQVVHFEVPGLEDVGFVAHPDLQDGKGWTVTETRSGTAVAVGVPTREEALRGVYDRLAGFDAGRFLANRDELIAKWGSAVQEPAVHSGGTGREPVAQAAQAAPSVGPEAPRYAMSLRETTHAKRGHPLYVVTLDERTSREAYEGLKKEFTKLGGYWSRYKGRGAIPGVQFEDKAKAEAFVARFGKKPAIQDNPPANAGTSAKESSRLPERAAQPADHAQEQSLGVNRDGREVFEDERGNRFVREGRVRLEAPVPVRPTRAGVAAEPRTPEELHRDGEHEYLTKEELAAFGAPETSTQAREGLNSPKEEQGARDDDARAYPGRSRPEVGLEGPSDLAPGEPAPGDVGSLPGQSGQPQGSHRPENAPVNQPQIPAERAERPGRRDSGGDAGGGRAGGRPGPERGKSARTPDRPAGAADLGVVGGPAAPEGDRAPGRDVSRDHNHRIAPDDVLAPGGNATRAKANLAAVRLLKELEAGNRLPTPQERKVLAQFSGWGSLAEEVFKADFENLANRYGGEVPASVRHSYPAALLDKYDAWRRRYGELHPNIGGLFNKEEWDAAKRSTLNAHYTDREVIAAMWDMARRLGFTGGQVVEPAAGIGHFLGLMPEDLAQASTLKGVELDSVTGRLLGKLYPAADIQVTGFQDARRMGNNTADLVISNVPFGDFPVSDKAHKDYSGWSIHNYFLARAVDVVRPGGLVAAITSHFSMDTTRWGRIREYLAGKADLVGAIRLPGTAFAKNAGTEVTTDILILRKKDGQAFEGQSWRQVEKVETPEGEAGVNEYFVSHPDMVLGRHSLAGSMHGGLEYTVLPDKGRPLAEQLREAVSKLPADVMGQGAAVAAKPLSEALDERADADMREGTLVLRDGEVFSVEDGRLTRPEWREGKLAESRAAIARQYVGVKIAAKDLVRTMLSEEATDAAIAVRQQALGRLYDAFVKKHGPFLDNRKLTFLRDDIEYPNVLALEKKEEKLVGGEDTIVVAKADIFTKRTIRPFAEPKTATSAEDAVKISLLYRGRVDAAKVGELLGLPAVEARRRLLESGAALENPETGLLETPQEYLSGNVRQKLQIARDSAASNPDYKRNVDALEAVQPPTKPISRIDTRLGATWIPDTVVSAFMEHMGVRWGRAVQTRTRAGEDGMSSWDVRGSLTQEAQNRWSVGDTDLLDILQDSLNLKLAKAYKYLPDGKGGRERVVDQEGTLLVQEKQKALQEEFLKFTRETPKIATELEALYDDRFGGQIPRQYNVPDVDHYPGAVETISLRDHQKRGVSRGLQENTLFAHGVGAGKTYLVTTLAMEARRLGTAKKPMIVVQGATLEQFAGAFKRLYPAANVLAPNADDRTRANRQRLLSQIATGDWDAVIVPHSFFNGLAISPERESAFIEEDLDALRADLRVAEADTSQERGRKSTRVKQIEKMILKREERLKKLLDARKDENVFFEDTGVDMLVVDEAHAYKRGDFVTKMDNVKGLDRDSSQRSMQLLLKSRYIAEKTGGKNVHLATGTPVSNTLAELWTALRYIRPDLLERFNVTQFDDFASTFCATKTDIEETATGDFKPVTRFNRYQNIGELIAMWKAGADIVLAEDLDYIQDIPKLKGGRPQEVSLERNPELTGYIQFLKQWRTEWERLTGKEKREQSHVPLLIYNLAQKAALDLRLVNPELEEAPGGKLDAAAGEIFKRYQAHQDTRAAQAVFSDIYQSSDKTFNIWKELKRKLVAKGIPAKEIAIIYDFNEKAREKLFAGVNAGEVRVVMGSTEKLGVGVNIQERLVALHHLAPPIRPMDWEQRNGRIRRQGNRFEEVEILAYGVKNTLDSVSFNILQNKQKFINQLLRGEIDGDVLENPFDDVQLSFEDMMAAFSGNPLAMERVKLEGQVRDLGRLRQAFQDEKAGRIRQLDLLRESRIPAIEASLAAAEKEVDRLQRAFPDLKAESFILKDGTFDRKAFTKRLTDWYDGIKERLEQETVGKTVAHYEGMRAKLGGSVAFETGGHAVEITVRPVPSSVVGTDSNRGDGLANVTEAVLSGSFTVKTKDGKTLFERNFGAPGGFVRAFNNGLEEAANEPERIRNQLARARESAASLERLVEERFTREDEYKQASDRLREVEEELKKAKNEDLAVADSGENAGETTENRLLLMRAEPRTEVARQYEAVKPVDLKGDEIADFSEPLDMRALRRAAMEHVAGENFRDLVTNAASGNEIIISAKGIRDSFSHGAGPEKIQAVAALPELLERAVPIPEGTERIGQQKTREIYAAKLRIGDKRFLAGLVVRQDANGRRFYDHELSRIEQENPGTVLPHQGAVSKESRGPWPSRGSVIKIIRQALGVNEGDLAFRRGQGPVEVASSPVARAVAEELRQGLQQVPALRGIVDIYEREADLPAVLQREIAAAGVSGRFYGAYDPESGRIVLVAGNIPHAKAAQTAFVQTLLRHEGRHGGLDMVLGGREARQAYMLQAARIMPKEVSRWLTRHGLDSTRETRAEAAEELLVSWAKDGTVHRALDRLLARIAQWVRTIFPNLRLTKAELRTLLAQADDFVDGKGLNFVAPLGRPLTAGPVFARGERAEAGEYSVADATMPREARTFGDAKRSAREFVGQELENDATGMAATVSNMNVRKMLSESAVGKSVSPQAQSHAVANLDRLFKIADAPDTHPDRGDNPNIKAIHRFYAPMIFDGEVLVAKMTVKEFADPREGTRIYSVESMEIEKAARVREASIALAQGRKSSPQAAFEVSARNREASISPEQERIPSPQAEFIDKIRSLEVNVKGGKDSGPRFARNVDLTGVPEEKRDVGRWFKDEVAANVRSVLPAVRGALQETAALGKILRSPEYWKHPVLKALYETFRDRTDTAHELLHKALAAGDAGDDSGRTILDQAKEALRDPKQRAILSEGVDHADVNEIAPEDMETWFVDHGAAEDTVRLWRTMRERYDMLLEERLAATRRLMDKARDAYGRKIVRRLIEAGIAAGDAKTFDAAAYNADKTLSEDLAPYASKVAGVVAAARKAGITIKDQLADVRIKGEDGASFSLRELVEHMGRLRGFYAPRLREVGEYVVRGQRTGADGKVERFRAHKEWRAGAEKLRGQMERAGWDMEPVGKVEKLPEATQGIIKALELAKTVESAVNQVGEDVDAGLVQELLETLADEVKARGFRSQSIRRTGRHGDAVQGYFKDAVERFTRYAGQTAYGLAKMEAAGKAAKVLFGQDGGPGIDIRKEPGVYRLAVDYLSENLRNPEAGDRVFALARSVASLKYLGLNPRSALVNLSSMATSVPAALHAYAMQGKGGFARVSREIARSMTDYLGVMTGKWGSFTADEKRLLEAVRKESLDDPQFIREALSTYRDTAGKSWSWLMGKTLALFGATEQLNRGATLLAGYRLARASGADHATATARARETSDRAHGVYDRATQPAWTWGTSAGARVVQSWYVYKKYGHNYLQLVHELFGKKDWQAATFALAAPMVLGGLGSQVAMSVVKGLFAIGGGDDPEKWVYDTIRDNIGGQAEELARFGLLGLATGTDMSGSIGTMIDMPGAWYDVLGPMGGLARDVLTGIGYFAAGQPGRGAEKILPSGVSKILQAARESAQGVTTSKNFPVVGDDGKRLMPSAGESVAKGLGFRPVREATSRARTSEVIEEEKTWGERRDRIYSRFRAFALDGGRDAAERQALVEAVGEYNRALADAGLSGRVAPITRESLLRQAERVAEPTKREKARLGQGTAPTRAVESLSGEDIEDLSHPFYRMRRTYAAARERYDALRQAGDLEGAARLRAETRLPLLCRLVGGVTAVHEEMAKVRRGLLPQDVKNRRLETLRTRERLAMDRAARFGTSLAANG